jgi:hypothetical protein
MMNPTVLAPAQGSLVFPAAVEFDEPTIMIAITASAASSATR